MPEIGVRELKEHTSEVLRRVREEKTTYRITHRGRVVAELTPTSDAEREHEEWEKIWAEMEKLGKEITRKWKGTASAVDAVVEQRREL
jgi:prevent-host-death family protein